MKNNDERTDNHIQLNNNASNKFRFELEKELKELADDIINEFDNIMNELDDIKNEL